MEQTSSVSIVVVSYRNNPELVRFITHVEQFGQQVHSLIVVANGLDENAQSELQGVRRGFGVAPSLTLLAGTQNLGYFGGAQVGFEHLRGESGVPDWLIVCNDDIRFDAKFFQLLRKRPAIDDVGVVAPDVIVEASGRHQNPFLRRRPSKAKLQFLLLVHSARWLMAGFLLLRRLRPHMDSPDSGAAGASVKPAKNIYAPHGSCMIFHRSYFERGCSLSYPSFLYYEELFVAETSARRKLKIEFDPALRVIHAEHTTTGRLPSARMMDYVRDSLAFVLREYF